jgi:hypothetical protein
MAGQAALLPRATIKSTIKSVECDAGKASGGGKKMSTKMSSQSKAE